VRRVLRDGEPRTVNRVCPAPYAVRIELVCPFPFPCIPSCCLICPGLPRTAWTDGDALWAWWARPSEMGARGRN